MTTKKGDPIISRTTTMAKIVKKLPDGAVNELMLRKAIRQCGIHTKQIEDSYIPDLIRHGMITESPPGRFRVTEEAQKPAKIVITVTPGTLSPMVLERITDALKRDGEYATIEEV